MQQVQQVQQVPQVPSGGDDDDDDMQQVQPVPQVPSGGLVLFRDDGNDDEYLCVCLCVRGIPRAHSIGLLAEETSSSDTSQHVTVALQSAVWVH